MSLRYPDLRAEFGMRFAFLARAWRRALEAKLAEVGLTDATWVPLVQLQLTGGGMSQKALALRIGVDGSSLVRVLDILQREGLIERRTNPDDGRAHLLSLTERGEQRVREIRVTLAEAEAELLAGISDEELRQSLRQIDRIEANLAQQQMLRREGLE